MSICRRYVSIDEACKERETYTEEENRKLRAAKIMIQYLKYRCYYPTSVMNYTGAFQRTGPFPTRAYRHLEIMANRIRREKHQANTPPIPLQEWPVLSSKLNSDVTSHILSFLDHLSIVEVAKISWSFYNAALVSRQKRVSLAGCDSFAETGVWNFTGMKYFSGRENSHLVTNKFLWFLNEAHPILAHVDLHGCDNLDTLLVAHFVELMSPRLKSFIFKFLPTKNIDSSESKYLSEALSKAPCLESLSLTLNRTCSQNFQFSSFDGNTSLKKLSVIADGATMLPKCLLNLEVLRLEFVDENPQWYWQHLAQSQYPSLKRLDVTVSNYAYPALGLVSTR